MTPAPRERSAGPVRIDSQDAMEGILESRPAPGAAAPDELPLSGSHSREAFELGLYQQHLEEIGFLAFSLDVQRDDFGTEWPRRAEDEERLAAHVDAIELGGDLALRCSRHLWRGEDPIEWMAAAWTLASVGDGRHVAEVLDRMKISAPEQRVPIAAALRRVESAVDAGILAWVAHPDADLRRHAAEILAFRRSAAHSAASLSLADADPAALAAKAKLFGALGLRERAGELESLLDHPAETVVAAAIESLLRLSSPRAADLCRTRCRRGGPGLPSAVLALAIAGRAEDLAELERLAAVPETAIAACEAIGALGNPAGVKRLLNVLEAGGAPNERAATALERLTGAGLASPAAASPSEDEEPVPEPGSGPRDPSAGPGAPAAAWRNWWAESAKRFTPGVRWRRGKPFSLAMLIEEMEAPGSSYRDRMRAYLELVARSGTDIPFEADWPTPRQHEALRNWRRWWSQRSDRFPEGRYHSAAERD